MRENEILKNEISALDEKLNKAVQFLLERIDELHQKKSSPVKSIGYKYREKE